MRYSSYNILSEYIPDMGYAILNGLSGAIDLISEELYDEINEKRTMSLEDIDDSILSVDEIEEYKKRGYITDLSLAEETDLARTIANSIEAGRKDYLVVIALNLNCNYRCTYCFERDSKYFTNNKDRILTKRQVDSIFSSLKDKEVKSSIQLFGGEPLTKDTVEIVDYIIQKGNAIGCSFKAVTNAHELQYFYEYLGEGKIDILQITVDGPKHIHDKRRISLDRTSSFDRIMKNIKYVVNEKKDVHIDLRINVDDTNIDYVESLLTYLDEEGMLSSGQVNPYISKVAGKDSKIADESALNHKIYDLSRKHPILSPDIDLQKIKFDLELALMLGAPLQRYCAYCAMLSMKTLVFSPDNCVYSCSEQVGKEEHAVGHFNEEGEIVWNEPLVKFYEDHKLVRNEKCISCRYALLCAGGCFKQTLYGKKEYSSRHCTLYQENYPHLLAEMVSEKLTVLSK